MIKYPEIDPILISLGPLKVRWYGLMYVLGYVVGWILLKWRARKGYLPLDYRACESFVTYMIIGMLLGARIVYALVYNWDVYSMNPLQIFKIWEGGLSFHGAALGMALASLIFARRHRVPWASVLDTIAFCASPGLFFGRMGNFINAELYGRPTDLPWAMIFPTDPEQLPRHPSQIYQGVTEGLLTFAILWWVQAYSAKKGQYRYGLLGCVFLICYGTFRILTEFAREPDKQLGFVLGPFSMGQILSAIMVVIGVVMAIWVMRRPPVEVRPQSEAELEGATPNIRSKNKKNKKK